jgi:hypothetical protein
VAVREKRVQTKEKYEIQGVENINCLRCSVGFTNHIGVVTGVRRQKLALSIGLS